MILAIYGAGGLGREMLELAKVINRVKKKWEKFIFIDDGDTAATISDCDVYKYDEAKEKYGNSLEIVIGIGEPVIREKLRLKVKEDAIYVPTLIHPDVYIPESVNIGEGVTIQTGCFVSVNVILKDNVFLQPKCAIGHDCILNEGCIVSAFGNLAGAVKVGRCSYLGMGANVKEQVSIGEYSIIGMGSVVFKGVPDGVIAMGNPARVLRRNDERQVFKH